MLSHTLRVESLRVTPHRDNKLVPTHIKHLPLLNLLLHIPNFSIPRQRYALHRVIDRFLDA